MNKEIEELKKEIAGIIAIYKITNDKTAEQITDLVLEKAQAQTKELKWKYELLQDAYEYTLKKYNKAQAQIDELEKKNNHYLEEIELYIKEKAQREKDFDDFIKNVKSHVLDYDFSFKGRKGCFIDLDNLWDIMNEEIKKLKDKK